MTPFDSDALASWYRSAMRTRMEELRTHRDGVVRGVGEVEAAVRQVGHALRGSGTSYGFPEVTDAGTLLEECAREDLLRRTDGALSVLSRVVEPGEAPGGPFAWLADVNGVETVDPELDLPATWAAVGERAGRTAEDVAVAVAEAYGLAAGDLDAPPAPSATRLVPQALARRLGILPLREDGQVIVVATADPVSPTAEVELRRITGRRPRPAVSDPESLRRAMVRSFGDEEGAERHAPEPPRGPDATTVLVLDDDAATRLLIRSVLEREEYGVVEGEDGTEGLQRLREHPAVDLAVVDLQMPGMDGRAFLEELRAQPSLASLPVVVVTGTRDPVLETDLIEAGADDYIHKPLDPRLFLARVAATLRRAGG